MQKTNHSIEWLFFIFIKPETFVIQMTSFDILCAKIKCNSDNQ